RTPDGGYAKSAGGAAGSTYHTFLVGLTYQLLGRPFPQPEAVLRFAQSRRREDGGYVEIAPMRRSGTNPTAAAFGVLQMLDEAEVDHPGLTQETKENVLEFLGTMSSAEGGLRANGRAPLSDLLSTFTGAWTLHQLGALDRLDQTAALRYVQTLALATGGFR